MSLNVSTPCHESSKEAPLMSDIEVVHRVAPEALSTQLLAASASISPKYLYDELGSKLFEAICLLPEYYPTRTEAAIIEQHQDEIVEAVGLDRVLVDLGAGNCAKAARLIPALQSSHYVPIDISVDFLQQAVLPLQQLYPDLPIIPLGMDFSHGVELPKPLRNERCIFFYPGSSIGNFPPDEAAQFLRGLTAASGYPSELLMGVDLEKPADVLQAAYDDPLGVTAAFNLNVLRHVNRLLGSDFDTHDWRHIALFNHVEHRMEMHLEARRALTVQWPGHSRRFRQSERIHTESSYKYTRDSLSDLLQRAGYVLCNTWTDANDWFAIVHARPLQSMTQ